MYTFAGAAPGGTTTVSVPDDAVGIVPSNLPSESASLSSPSVVMHPLAVTASAKRIQVGVCRMDGRLCSCDARSGARATRVEWVPLYRSVTARRGAGSWWCRRPNFGQRSSVLSGDLSGLAVDALERLRIDPEQATIPLGVHRH